MKELPIEVSARHIHLSQKDLEALFGNGYQLKKIKDLSQPGDFAAEETLSLKNKERVIEKARIVGPARENTQIELSKTDAFNLGINPEIEISGKNPQNEEVVLSGPKGEIKINSGVIIPWRHIHCNKKEAKDLKIKEGDLVSVKVEGDRGLVFNNVAVRVNEKYKLSMHIDTDEGNAAGINHKTIGFLA